MQKEKEAPSLAEITADAPEGAPRTGERIVADRLRADPFLARRSPATPGAARQDAAETVTVESLGAPPRQGEPIPARAPENVRANGDATRVYAYSPLLFSVEVSPWPQRYNYYQRFLSDAERYFSARGEACAPEPYFSYIPQYSQLGRAQLAFYFWFRECARRGEYLDGVDFPYILLYIYEIINLPRRIAPAAGAEALAGVWLAYRARYPELDKYLAEWMCDYCLVYGTALPASMQPVLPAVIRRATLKEFYISAMPGASCPTAIPADVLVAAGSDYSYRASRYYGANAALYDEHIPAAAVFALRKCGLWNDETGLRAARAERDAFCGSLCAQTVKRRLRITYYSLARSYELRSVLTQAVKAAENGVRRAAKIKSRLNVSDAPAAIAAAVNEYFAAALPPERTRRAAADTSYERYYDAAETGMDFARSHAIEAASWANTELLAPQDAAEALPPAPQPETETKAAPPGGVPEAELLRAMLSGGTLEAFCRAHGGAPNDAAARVNEYFADAIGDVVLEQDGAGSWRLIEDYRFDVEAALGEP